MRNLRDDAPLIRSVMISNVITVRPSDSLKWALTRILAFDVGSIVVVDDENRPIGILTERDIRRKIVVLLERLGAGVLESKVSDSMSTPVTTIRPDATITEGVHVMFEKRIKRLPVVDDQGRLVGIVSEGNLLALLRSA